MALHSLRDMQCVYYIQLIKICNHYFKFNAILERNRQSRHAITSPRGRIERDSNLFLYGDRSRNADTMTKAPLFHSFTGFVPSLPPPPYTAFIVLVLPIRASKRQLTADVNKY